MKDKIPEEFFIGDLKFTKTWTEGQPSNPYLEYKEQYRKCYIRFTIGYNDRQDAYYASSGIFGIPCDSPRSAESQYCKSIEEAALFCLLSMKKSKQFIYEQIDYYVNNANTIKSDIDSFMERPCMKKAEQLEVIQDIIE